MNKLFKKELWKDLRFPEGRLFEDIDTIYKVTNLCKKITVIDDILYMNRIRSGSITNSYSLKSVSDRLLACELYESLVKKDTPTIITSEEFSIFQQRIFEDNNTTFSRLTCYNDYDKALFNELRHKIIIKGNEVGTDSLRRRAKLEYIMIRYCPVLLRLTYPVFHIVKQRVSG